MRTAGAARLFDTIHRIIRFSCCSRFSNEGISFHVLRLSMSESPNEQPRKHILNNKSKKTMQKRGNLEKGNFLLSLIFCLMLMIMEKFHARESEKRLTLLCLK